MLERLKRIALTAIGAIGMIVQGAIKRQARVSPEGLRLLRHLATHTSASVSELSSRLKLPVDDTLRLLAELEKRGSVQLSADQGVEHVRIAAITKAGRGQIA
jgi:DNA-binding MarR family transcriptional regulator